MATFDEALEVLSDLKEVERRAKLLRDIAGKAKAESAKLTKAKNIDKALTAAQDKEARAEALLADAKAEALATEAKAVETAKRIVSDAEATAKGLRDREAAAKKAQRDADKAMEDARALQASVNTRAEKLKADTEALEARLERFKELSVG